MRLIEKGEAGSPSMHLSFVLALTLQFNFRFTSVKIQIELKFLVFDLRQTIFKICFWDLLFSLVTVRDQSNLRLVKILVIAELWGVRGGRRGAPWLRKSGYPCIWEVLVGTWAYARTPVRPHHRITNVKWFFYFVWSLQPVFKLMIAASPCPCTVFSHAFSVNSLGWRIRSERTRNA